MEVWQLAVSMFGVIVAFIVGVFTEPVKQYFENRHKIQQLRIILYREMSHLYYTLKHQQHFIENLKEEDEGTKYYQFLFENTKLNFKKLQFNCYNYAKSEIALFYQIREVVYIEAVYSSFQDIASTDFDTFEQLSTRLGICLTSFASFLTGDMLDDKLLLNVCIKDMRETIRAAIKDIKSDKMLISRVVKNKKPVLIKREAGKLKVI